MRSRHAVRLVTATLVAGSAAFGFMPLAQASSDRTITPSTEAWYQPNPTCLLPAGCLTTGSLPVAPPAELTSLPAANPYPAGTLHVGVTCGQETARTYLRYPLEQLEGLTVTSATLSIPLDVNTQNGNATPEASKVLICETSSSRIDATEGTIDAPPPLDCAVSVPMTYVATPQPHLQATLGRMAADLPGITGLVLLPDASKTAQSDAWQVVFSAHTRADAAKTAPATLTVTVDDGTTDEFIDTPIDEELPAVDVPQTGGIPGVVPVTNTGFADVPTVQAPVTSPVAPTVDQPAPQAATTEPKLVTVGYAYPAVWLLPLGFLVLVPVVARALTKDLSDSGD